jgi:hypothetical protein
MPERVITVNGFTGYDAEQWVPDSMVLRRTQVHAMLTLS